MFACVTPTEQLFYEALMAGGEPLTLDDLLRRPSSQSDGLCREHPGVNWHPERGEPTEPAKAVCRRCLCRVECLDHALVTGEEHGVWGGESPRPAGRRSGGRTRRPEKEPRPLPVADRFDEQVSVTVEAAEFFPALRADQVVETVRMRTTWRLLVPVEVT